MVNFSNVLLKIVNISEVCGTAGGVSSVSVASEEFGHRVEHEGDDLVIGFSLDEAFNGGKILFVDCFHLLSLTLKKLSLNFDEILEEGRVLLCF